MSSDIADKLRENREDAEELRRKVTGEVVAKPPFSTVIGEDGVDTEEKVLEALKYGTVEVLFSGSSGPRKTLISFNLLAKLLRKYG